MPSVVAIADVVADRLGLPAGSADVVAATAAAWAWVRNAEDILDTTDPHTVPDDVLVEEGLTGFARDVYRDQYQSIGSQTAYADGTVESSVRPLDLYRHWSYYFVPLRERFGVS